MKRRTTLVRIEVDASWSSLLWSVAAAVAILALAFWWVYGK